MAFLLSQQMYLIATAIPDIFCREIVLVRRGVRRKSKSAIQATAASPTDLLLPVGIRSCVLNSLGVFYGALCELVGLIKSPKARIVRGL